MNNDIDQIEAQKYAETNPKLQPSMMDRLYMTPEAKAAKARHEQFTKELLASFPVMKSPFAKEEM